MKSDPHIERTGGKVARADELTGIEQQVLLAALRLHPDGYGVTLRDEIERTTGKHYSYGTMYAVLERMQSRGFMTSREGEATAERGGRRKMHFTVSGVGRRVLDASLRASDALRKGVLVLPRGACA